MLRDSYLVSSVKGGIPLDFPRPSFPEFFLNTPKSVSREVFLHIVGSAFDMTLNVTS